jgi:hypothetical protein
LRTELKDAYNETVRDDAFIHYILDGLGRAYKEFVRQYRYGNETLTSQELKNRLLFAEMTVQQNDAESGESRKVHAFQVAAHGGRPQMRGNPRPNLNGVHSIPRRTEHATSLANMDTGRGNVLSRRMLILIKGKGMGLDLQ